MLYPTLNQPLVTLCVFVAGIFSGLFFDLAKVLTFLSGGDKWSKHLFDFFATSISFVILFLTNLFTNLGQFRVYVLLVFLTGFLLQRFFSNFLWTKVLLKWYNDKRGKNVEKKKMD